MMILVSCSLRKHSFHFNKMDQTWQECLITGEECKINKPGVGVLISSGGVRKFPQKNKHSLPLYNKPNSKNVVPLF